MKILLIAVELKVTAAICLSQVSNVTFQFVNLHYSFKIRVGRMMLQIVKNQIRLTVVCGLPVVQYAALCVSRVADSLPYNEECPNL